MRKYHDPFIIGWGNSKPVFQLPRITIRKWLISSILLHLWKLSVPAFPVSPSPCEYKSVSRFQSFHSWRTTATWIPITRGSFLEIISSIPNLELRFKHHFCGHFLLTIIIWYCLYYSTDKQIWVRCVNTKGHSVSCSATSLDIAAFGFYRTLTQNLAPCQKYDRMRGAAG